MTTTSTTNTTAQVYQVFIKATPQAIWDAITTPEWTEKHGYKGRAEYDLRPGGAYRALASEAMVSMGGPDVVVDGEVVVAGGPSPRPTLPTCRRPGQAGASPRHTRALP